MDQIAKDLPRTFAGLGDEAFRNKLERVLHGFVVQFPGCYTQGMALVCAGLLVVMEDEGETYGMLHYAMTQIIPHYFSREMRGIHLDAAILLEMIEAELSGELYDVLQDNVLLIMSRWCIILFLDSFPSEMVFRIWDLLFVKGCGFLFCFQLAVLQYYEAELVEIGNDVDICLFLDEKLAATYDLEELFFDALRFYDAGYNTASIQLRRQALLEAETNLKASTHTRIEFKVEEEDEEDEEEDDDDSDDDDDDDVVSSSSNPISSIASSLTDSIVSFISRSSRGVSPTAGQRICTLCDEAGEFPLYKWKSLGETTARAICDECFETLRCASCGKHRPDVEDAKLCGDCRKNE
jgi:hypothetical protein